MKKLQAVLLCALVSGRAGRGSGIQFLRQPCAGVMTVFRCAVCLAPLLFNDHLFGRFLVRGVFERLLSRGVCRGSALAARNVVCAASIMRGKCRTAE